MSQWPWNVKAQNASLSFLVWSFLFSYGESIGRISFQFLLASFFVLLRVEIYLGTIWSCVLLAQNWPGQLYSFLPCCVGNREGWLHFLMGLLAISLRHLPLSTWWCESLVSVWIVGGLCCWLYGELRASCSSLVPDTSGSLLVPGFLKLLQLCNMTDW